MSPRAMRSPLTSLPIVEPKTRAAVEPRRISRLTPATPPSIFLRLLSADWRSARMRMARSRLSAIVVH